MTSTFKGVFGFPYHTWRRVQSWCSTHDRPIVAIPVYAWRRFQERRLIRKVAPLDKQVSLNDLPVVRLARAETIDQCDQLVDLYWRNPSPLAWTPRTATNLEQCFLDGIEYYLVYNEDDELVGARAIRIKDAYVMHATIDRRFRRQGYWLASEESFCRLLAERGFTRLVADVFRENTPMIRSTIAAGWTPQPHPTEEGLVRLTKAL